MYAGLTIADKGALMDAKARGAEWVARDEYRNRLFRYVEKPERSRVFNGIWRNADGDEKWKHMDDENLLFIQWSDPEPVNIDLALAQIAEMDKAKPDGCEFCVKHSEISGFSIDGEFLVDHSDYGDNSSLLIYFCPICGRNLNSPYTEGATK